ncbi:MAG TPA: GMC family oxidoreductase [Gemmatimonadaceae bacterium]
MKKYRPTDEVDFVVVGSGAAGGVMARELSQAGFSVVVLEQGPWLTEEKFKHDEIFVNDVHGLTNDHALQPNTFRESESEAARKNGWAWYGRLVGGGSVHFTANYWRFPELEFEQASRFGVPDGSSVADWPITYAELEPYYTKVEWEIGVSGLAGNPFEPPRSKPFPLPPLPIKSEGVLMEKGARKLGWHPWPAPMAILSQSYRGRSGCMACGFCFAFGCEWGAKSSTLVAMIPAALATGRCEIRPNAYARKIETANGRVTGVVYFDKDRKEVVQRAKAVVLSANGVETVKLLLMSQSNAFPQGLANASGEVGRNIMFNGNAGAGAIFEHEVNGWKGAVVSRVTWDQVLLPKELGFYGGGGFDLRANTSPIGAAYSTPPGVPAWGREWKKSLRKALCNTAVGVGHTSQLPVTTNRVDLDPTEKDAWGLPAPRLTFKEHPNDTKMQRWFSERARELLLAAGAQEITFSFGGPSRGGPHLLGTCRMGNDPRTSVVNAGHRAHDVPNLFIVDGSSFVTSGRGQPTMTIQALAFRAADRITKLAKTGAIRG